MKSYCHIAFTLKKFPSITWKASTETELFCKELEFVSFEGTYLVWRTTFNRFLFVCASYIFFVVNWKALRHPRCTVKALKRYLLLLFDYLWDFEWRPRRRLSPIQLFVARIFIPNEWTIQVWIYVRTNAVYILCISTRYMNTMIFLFLFIIT